MTKTGTSFKIPLKSDEGEDNPHRDKNEDNQDRGDAMVEQLSKLQEGIFSVPIKTLVWTMAILLKESFFISFSTLGSQLVVASGYMLLNAVDDTDGMAVLGISMSFNLIFYYVFTGALCDKVGIDAAQTFGAKQYHLTKKVMTQSIMASTSLFLCIIAPSFLAAAPLLKLAGIDSDLASQTSRVLPLVFINDVIECCADLIQAFCMAQGIERHFGPVSMVSWVFSSSVGYILVVQHGLGVAGYIISSISYSSCQLVIAVSALSLTHPETKGLMSIRAAKEGFVNFVWTALKFALGSYIEFIGYEIASLFVYRTNDVDQIAAITSMVSFTGLAYYTGYSLSIISRTRMNLLAIKNMKEAAQNLFKLQWVGCFMFGYVISAGIFLFNRSISDSYSDSNQNVFSIFSVMLKIYCLLLPFELMICTSFMGLKTVGRIGLLTGLNMVAFILLQVSGNIILEQIGANKTQIIFTLRQVVISLVSVCGMLAVSVLNVDGITLNFSDL